ncbi:EamA family transporter [Pseudoalteromonas fenneropenaei]|uniref:EamA family transporter n=1 Tax=Pseudoalteromonas fenneropenaei TaxID=1737459 RepID=A0ABV7CMH4_9GAMM
MFLALIASICWAMFDFVRKQLAVKLSAAQLTVVFAALALPVYCINWFRQDLPMPTVNYYLPALASGICAAIGSLYYIHALKQGELSRVLPLLSLTPVVAALAGFILLSERLALLQWLAIIGITLGCMLIRGGVSMRHKGTNYAVITAIAWGLCIVFDKLAIAAASVSFHAVFLSLCILLLNYSILRPKFSVEILSHRLWLIIGAVVFAAAVLTQMFAIAELSPGIVEAIKRAVGILSALLLGALVLKEQVSKRQVLLSVVLIALVFLLVTKGA